MNTLQDRLRANPITLSQVLPLCQEAADRLDELEADAERYRWLRDVHTHHYTVTRYVGGATIPRFEGAQLDAAIDAARSKT